MEKNTSSTERKQRSVEDWVDVAKNFGDQCLAIQRDEQLHLNEKLNRQKELGAQLSREIQEDAYLTDKEKRAMFAAIQRYFEGTRKVYEGLKDILSREQK